MEQEGKRGQGTLVIELAANCGQDKGEALPNAAFRAKLPNGNEVIPAAGPIG